MKKYKKLLAVLLALTLAFGSSITTFAEEIDISGGTESFEIDDTVYTEGELSFGDESAIDTIDAESEDKLVIDDESEDELVIEDESEGESEGETSDIQPSVEENEDEAVEDTEIEGSFPGVDIVGFCSDAEIVEDKETLNEHLDGIKTCVPDVDYVEGEIIVAAPDEETAEIYAEGFGGKLAAYCDGFCLIYLDTDDEDGDGYSLCVADAILASADPENALPAAYPNYKGEWTDDCLDDCLVDYLAGYSEENAYDDMLGSNEWESDYNDPYLKGTSSYFQYQHELLQTEAAWRAGYRGSGVKVVVLDSGAYEDHEDLTLAGKGAVDSSTQTFKTLSASKDIYGHGTHCCGCVGAKANNSKGGAGIAPDVSLYAARISYDTKNEYNQTVDSGPTDWGTYIAIKYATNTWKVNVMSMSLSIGQATSYSASIESAVEAAYQAGIAIFGASGNYGCNMLSYPAKCEHAIAVGAVNAANVKTDFSNLNEKVRYSGPGYDILSTYIGSTSTYERESGTSMATPCIAGAAAVILSSGKIKGSGHTKVDNLLAFMDKSCVASGIGKGTPNLAKAFGLANINAVPNAPTASVASGVITASSKSVNLKSESGTTIYYDKKGGNITVKNGVVSSNATSLGSNSGSVTLYASTGGKQVLKAIAIDNNTKLVSKIASFTYTFKPAPTGVAIGSKALDFIVLRGSSLQLTATVTPSCAVNKTVTWSIPTAKNGVSIGEKTGKLVVDKNYTESSVTVRATAVGGTNIYKEQTIKIEEAAKIKSVKAKNGSLTVYAGSSNYVYITTLDNDGATVSNTDFLSCSYSKTGIAEATINKTYALIKGTSPGKTVITFYSNDGTYKKTTVTVNVLQKVSTISLAKTTVNIVQGGNYTPSVTISPDNASNKKLKWTLKSVPSGVDIKKSGISVNASSGKVSVSRTAAIGTYTIGCEAADGQNANSTMNLVVKPLSQKITNLSLNQSSLTLFRVNNGKNLKTSATVSATVKPSGYSSNLEVLSNSTPSIATATISSGTITVKATGEAIGTTNITVATTDGTNIKKVIKVKVINPPTGLALSLPKDRSYILGYGKSMKITPIFYTDNGPIDASSKKLKWSSSSIYISVSSNGTVKNARKLYSVSDYYDTTITAETTDGSGLKATIVIKPNTQITKLTAFKYCFYENGKYIGYVNDKLPDASLGEAGIKFTLGRGCSGLYIPISYTVSGPKDGCFITNPSSGIYYIFMLKKGNYSIKFKTTDGSNRSSSVSWTCKYNY